MSTITCCIGYAMSFFLLVFGYKLWKFLYQYFIGHALGHTPDLRRFGQWCVVTGCTSGIGKSYAHAFAKLGLDIVLISRDPKKLETMEKDLVEKYGVKVKVIVADFSSNSDDLYKEIKDGLSNLDIGILVNNAGVLHRISKFCDIPNIEGEIQNTVNVNMVSHTRLTSLVLPKMAERNRGLILFISSTAAAALSPYFQLYGSTKAYLDYFSRALNEEYGSESLIIQSVLPGPVCTNILRTEPDMFFLSADNYVKYQLRTIGLTPRTFGYFAHEISYIFIKLIQAVLPKKFWMKLREFNVNYIKEKAFSYQVK